MRFIIMPETGVGKGTGHLVRCIDLAGVLAGAELFIAGEQQSDLKLRYPVLESLKIIGAEDLPIAGAELGHCVFIVDHPQVSETVIRYLLERGLVIGIDLIGPSLRRVPFVIDLLPRLREDYPWQYTNLKARHFLDLPVRQRETPSAMDIKKVLVSFGGEDPAGLRRRLILSGVVGTCLPGATVDLLNGPRMDELDIPMPPGWQLIPALPRLRDQLQDWDLVITSFGLTAYEALAVGCRVVLINPAPYHEALARRDGLPSCGMGKLNQKSFRAALVQSCVSPIADSAKIAALPKKLRGPRGLAHFLKGLSSISVSGCPACLHRANPVIARYEDRTFLRCDHCGMVYQQLFGEQTINYNEAYFFEDYQKQYGKTYLDDFQHIKAMGNARLDRMVSHGHAREAERLLDIGCAYGPFLSAARERGLLVQGCDISPEACTWVSENLGIPALAGDIRKLDKRDFGTTFDLITMWYVIEHFPDLHRVLTKINALLVSGGMFALATPSGEGISARLRPRHFYQHSPRDHYTIWRPSQISKLLELYGFRLASIKITGHHPERFPGLFGSKTLRPISSFLSRILGLGDTFELYAIKIADLDQRKKPQEPAL